MKTLDELVEEKDALILQATYSGSNVWDKIKSITKEIEAHPDY